MPVTHAKFVATEGNVAKILFFEPEVFFLLKVGISPVIFSLKEQVISYKSQIGRERQNINDGNLNRPTVITT